MTRAPANRGFTLMEVMIALSLLGLALTVLIKSSANSIFSAEQARMMGVVTDLARGKMYDVEEKLLKDGFTDTDQSECKDFNDEGWPGVTWCSKVITVELPSWSHPQNMAQGHMKAMAGSGSAAAAAALAAGSGSGSALSQAQMLGSAYQQYGSAFGSAYGSAFGSGSADNPFTQFQNSALGGMLGMMGGGGGFGAGSGDADSQRGGSFIQQQFTMVQQVLKVSIRKVVLTISWKVLGRPQEMTVVCFFTDPAQMDQVLNGLGSTDIGDGSGSGSGSSTTTNTSSTIKTSPGASK